MCSSNNRRCEKYGTSVKHVTEETLKSGLKIHKGKTSIMTKQDTTDETQIHGTEIEKVAYYKYLGQTIAMENKTR